jgi:hypothetical protein
MMDRPISTQRRGGELLLAAVVCLITLTACGTAGQGGLRSAHRIGPVITRADVGVSAALPQDYGGVTFMTGDQSGSGVWTWNGTANSSDSVCHVAGQGTVTCWPVMTGAGNQSGRASSGFAVSGSSVWLGINSEAVELDTTTGKVTTWAIPTPRDNPVAEQLQGPNPEPHAVQALAVSPTGQVAVGLSFSSSVEVLDPSTGAWTQIPLPGIDDEPITVGYSASGELAAGFANLDIHLDNGLLISPANEPAVTATVTSAWSIQAYGTDDFLVGATDPQVVSPDGTAAALNTPLGLVPPIGPAEPAYLPGSQVAFPTSGGVTEFPDNAASPAAATAGAATVALPSIPCPANMPQPPPPNGATPSPQPTSCPQEVMLLTTDSNGNIWIVTEDQQSTVKLIAPQAAS